MKYLLGLISLFSAVALSAQQPEEHVDVAAEQRALLILADYGDVSC